MLRSMLDGYRRAVVSPRAGRALAARAAPLSGDVGGLTDLSLSWKYGAPLHPPPLSPISVRPLQIRDELAGLAAAVDKLRPRVIVEIGTASGGTLFLWSWLVQRGGLVVSLDLPPGQFAGENPLGNEGYPAWRGGLYTSFSPPSVDVELLKVDSHDPATRDRVQEIVGDREVDFLFIDGDHSYDGVRADFEMYSPLVREGGGVAFHDVVERAPHTGCEVDRLWKELRERHRHEEFVEDWEQGWAGIGLLYM